MHNGPIKFRTAPQADIELPREVSRLRELVYNLWWAWNPPARRMFSHIQPRLWAIYRNPVELLINIEPHHWESLLEDDMFLTSYKSVLREFDAYMSPNTETWYSKNYSNIVSGPVVYFSTEYGFHESLRTYSGGLGILSGDHCKSASDLGLPFIAIGPLYKHGYFDQEIGPEGQQQHFYPAYDFSRLPIRPVLAEDGYPLTVGVDFPDRTVFVQVWLAQVGRVPVLLLDTDINKNDPADRPITGQLYVSGREMRICQEIVMGMGGVRVLQALEIEPSAWHLNEGHCAFLGLERIRTCIQQGLTFEDACNEIAKNSIFTTHTPVPAGNEAFNTSLINKYFSHYCADLEVSMDQLLKLGQSQTDRSGEQFSMTILAIQLTSYCNGVSQLHGQVSNEMWEHVYEGEKPIQAITNGVHTQTWLGFYMADLFDKYLTPAWRDNLMDELFWKRAVPNIPDKELWEIHNLQKENLIRFVRGRIREQLARHGKSPDELRAVDHILNTEALTIGFGRRFATYKRADLFFRDIERIQSVVKNSEYPVQLIFGGKAHPADKPGQELIRRIFELTQRSDLFGHIVFLENYNVRVARMMVQGVDVWLNNPRRPMEASGTSGMKAPINGGINFSIADGWWGEAANGSNGWTIGIPRNYDNQEEQDLDDSESMYDILETEIVPLYYKRDNNGLPVDWIQMMKASMATITPRFSTARMVADYVQQAYVPAITKSGIVKTATDNIW